MPQFLVVSCINKEMAMKNVDFNINLKNFLYPGMPLNGFYDLFAFIYKENYESKYIDLTTLSKYWKVLKRG